MERKNSKSQLWPWLLLVVLAMIWGSSFILMKRGKYAPDDTPVFSAEQVASLRIIIAFLVLIPAAIINRKHLFGPSWKWLLAVGLFGNAIPAFLFTAAQSETNSSFIGMLNSLVPLFTLVLGVAAFKLKVKWINVVGILIAMGGAVSLILVQNSGQTDGSISEAMLVVGATICYAISVNIIKRYLSHLSPIAITALSFTFIAVPLSGYLFTTNYTEVLTSNDFAWSSMGFIAILAIVGTALALLLFNKLVAITTPVFASSVTYLIPIVAIFWGWTDGEPLAPAALLCSAIILGGVYMVNRK